MVCAYSPSVSELEVYNRQFAESVPGITLQELNEKVPVSFEERGWGTFKGGTIGTCNFPFMGQPGAIRIDPNFWTQASTLQKKGLMWHELGHCACTLGHSIEIDELDSKNWFIKFLNNIGIKTNRKAHLYFDDGCPRSLMYPRLPSDSCLERHWQKYEDEIKNNCRPFSLYEFGINFRKSK